MSPNITSTRRKWPRQSEVFESDFKLWFFIINHFRAIGTIFIDEQASEYERRREVSSEPISEARNSLLAGKIQGISSIRGSGARQQ